MDEASNPYLPPVVESAPPPTGPGDALDITRAAAISLAVASFLAVVVLFILGQIIQLMNIPLGLTVTSLFIFGAAGLFFPVLLNLRPFRFTGMSRSGGNFPLTALLIGLVNLPFANFLMALMMMLLPESWGEEAKATTKLLLHADQVSRALIVVAAGLAAPLGEELFFRGWLQPLLARRLGTVLSVVLVAIAFSAIHFDMVGFVARVELGVLFGLARAWTGSLWPAIALHATHNLISTAALYFAPDEQAQVEPHIDWSSDFPMAILSLVLMLSVVRAFRRATQKLPEETPTVVPLRLRLRPALMFGMGNFLVLASATTVLYLFQDRLPGTELTKPIRERLLHQLERSGSSKHPETDDHGARPPQ